MHFDLSEIDFYNKIPSYIKWGIDSSCLFAKEII